jgi:hypothetical protein
MRPQHADKALSQLGQFVVELVAQAPHQESKAFEESLDVRVAHADALKA